MARRLPPHSTFAYKQIGNQDVLFDIYLPEVPSSGSLKRNETVSVPAVVYFHGGGLTVGNRESWFPFWLHSRRQNVNWQRLVSNLVALQVEQ